MAPTMNSDEVQPSVVIEIVDRIGHIRLNEPSNRNALSDSIKKGLLDALSSFAVDPEVRAVLITAAGRDFMVGADLKLFRRQLIEDRPGHLAGFEQRVRATNRIFNLLREMEKPVLIAVQGATVGFGLCLVAAADLCIAADDAFFILAYRHIGLAPDGAITYQLPRIVGERKALEIALLGDRFDASVARDLGLVNWVAERDSLEGRAWDVARRLASGPALALSRAKQLIRGSLDRGWDEQLSAEVSAVSECAASADHSEGLDAFVEKRAPVFR